MGSTDVWKYIIFFKFSKLWNNLLIAFRVVQMNSPKKWMPTKTEAERSHHKEQRKEGRKQKGKRNEKKTKADLCGYSLAHLLMSNQAFKHRAVNKSSDQTRTKSQT